MNIRNLTKHPINVRVNGYTPDLGDVESFVTIPPDSGGGAHTNYYDEPRLHLKAVADDPEPRWRIAVTKRVYGPLTGVPEFKAGVWLVVSSVVAHHPDLRNRTDILVTNRILKDACGRIRGCEGLRPGPGVPL
jgi:hypothetical protein